MLTYEQIDNLKEGDTLLLAVILERKITHGYFKVKTSKDSCVTASTIRLFLPPEKPKYDPTRLFKEGDKVKPAERHGRKTPKLNYKAEYTVTSSEDDYGTVGVEYFNGDMPVSVSIPFYWLELVTPVEELEPYYIETETFDYEIRNANDDPDIGTSLALHIKIQDPDEGQILRVKSYYESYVYSREHAIADAEAECKRLNDEWRKEQNRD
jgi:hypothetical protein